MRTLLYLRWMEATAQGRGHYCIEGGWRLLLMEQDTTVLEVDGGYCSRKRTLLYLRWMEATAHG